MGELLYSILMKNGEGVIYIIVPDVLWVCLLARAFTSKSSIIAIATLHNTGEPVGAPVICW